MDLGLYIVTGTMPIIDVMQKIGYNGKRIAFVCNGKTLEGCVTDGDIRRHLIAGGSLTAQVSEIANYHPVYLEEDKKSSAAAVMERHYVTAVPIVNSERELIDICFWRGEHSGQEKNIPQLTLPLVIMAGGKGTRLKPYTDILPKPLIPIGEKTITEYIVENFAKYGCSDVTMIVNYKKDFIKAYFNDSETGNGIKFIEEQEYMGTGGGLKLLKECMTGTFFMSNCDILVEADYDKILEYHRKMDNIITMVCAGKKFQVPYGTVQVDEAGQIVGLQEKPELSYRVNTGLYLIEPRFLDKIPDGEFIHITDIIEKCLREKERVGAFLIEDDDWMDMGQMDELESMRKKMGFQ
ncbi:MAG: NTP transferase domain-containing protein [Lachnospiraceae bacterium]|jgi:dTDP-glucose pyrophosphorylase|nr:NTP transferase domain-containing protein [Lachnospiraceae bacterium]